MFTKPFNFLNKKLTISQQILFSLLKWLLKFMDIPLFPQFPLMSFGLNFRFIVEMAWYDEVPQKLIDFTLDASERYYLEFNTDSEILYNYILLLKTPKKFRFFCLLCLFQQFFKSWKINFYYWIYAISYPLMFLAIFLYIDYLDGHFD